MSLVRPVFKCSEAYKESFKNSQALMTISVGQGSHEGEMFRATVDSVNAFFGSCVILVDDSLQRHTMAISSSKSADFFYELSLREGDLWLERNRKYYERLTIPTRIIRWDMWLRHRNFRTQQEKVKVEIDSDPSYKLAFDTSIDAFLRKYLERLSDKKAFDLERARKLSFDFVLEECTALCLWIELQCLFEIYPNKHNRAIEETRKRFILKNHPHLLNPVTIGFRNAKQLKSQQFELLQREKVLGE